MARAKKAKKKTRKRSGPSWARTFWDQHRQRLLRVGGVALLMIALLSLALFGLQRLEAHVQGGLAARAEPAQLFLVDLPEVLGPLAEAELRGQLTPLMGEAVWTDARLCRALAERLDESGWVARVNAVRRGGDGCFRVSCRYRTPFALVQQGGQFLLVDEKGVRLPGTYRYDASWPLVQGLAAAAPGPGFRWDGEDLQAGLDLIRLLQAEPFASQITGVLVNNFDGRYDRRQVHLELATDQAGGRIRWGSPLGREMEENQPAQKLALLRENHRRTGRADAGHPVIDVSTFPDRFTIPG